MAEVARVTEISVRSQVSFEDAIKEGVWRATSSLQGVTGAWVKDQRVEIEENKVVGYQVNLLVTYLLEAKN